MDSITRTIYGSELQTCLLLGIPLAISENSTLNEKLGIQSTVMIAQDQVPSMRYAAIGNGGHKMIMGANNISRPEPVLHEPTDASLFNQIPFVLRDTTNDLTTTERAGYALRRLEEHDGKTYIAYYLKRLDYSNVGAAKEYKSVLNGVTTSTPFVPNNSNLNPTPPNLSSTGVNVTTGNYVSVTANIPFTMSEAEVNELINVSKIIYGDEGYSIISEIALCSGVDKVITTGVSGGIGFNFNEVIGAQIVGFVNGFYHMKFSNSGLNIIIDSGATEPLNTLTNVP